MSLPLSQQAVNQTPLHPSLKGVHHQGSSLESSISMSSCPQQPLTFSISAKAQGQLIQTPTATWCPNVFPYRSCPAAMPFEIILRISHSFLTSWHKMLQAHPFHLPQTWNLPLPQEAMNLSNGKQYLTLGLFMALSSHDFQALLVFIINSQAKACCRKTNLQAKETVSHLLLYTDYWDSYLLEGNLSLPGKVCVKEKKEKTLKYCTQIYTLQIQDYMHIVSEYKSKRISNSPQLNLYCIISPTTWQKIPGGKRTKGLGKHN